MMHTVLVAEDDVSLQRLLVKTMSHAGHRVLAASNGQEAANAMRRLKPDLMLLDLGLPDLSGLDVLSIREKHGVDVKVVVITGNARAAEDELVQHADLFLLKPIDTRELVDLVSRLLAPKWA